MNNVLNGGCESRVVVDFKSSDNFTRCVSVLRKIFVYQIKLTNLDEKSKNFDATKTETELLQFRAATKKPHSHRLVE